MICFNCDTNISRTISYHHKIGKIGLAQFFPNLSIGHCSFCKISQVNHRQLQKDKLNTYYSHVCRETDSSDECDNHYLIARTKAQAKLIKKYTRKPIKNIFEFCAGCGHILFEIKKLFPEINIFRTNMQKI